MINVIGFSLYDDQAASHRVRLSQFKAGLALVGIDLRIQSFHSNEYLRRRFSGGRAPSVRRLAASYQNRFAALDRLEGVDLAIVYAELLPLMPAWLEQKLLRIPYVLDLDDAFYLKYNTGRLGLLSPILGSKFERVMAHAAAITAGSHHLAAYACRFNPKVTVVPSVVDTEQLRPASKKRPRGSSSPFTIGWMGSPSTAPYLQILKAPLQRLAQERSVRLVVVGARAPDIPGVEVIEQKWRLDHEAVLIQQFDVGVMPLPDTVWARGKCAYKLIQYMACAVPVVASPIGANVDAVPASCGLLASSSIDWLGALRKLADDQELCSRMGAAGRQWVQERYSFSVALPLLESVICDVISSAE